MENHEDKVREIIVEQLGVTPDQVVADASFIDDLGADSLDTVEIRDAGGTYIGVGRPNS